MKTFYFSIILFTLMLVAVAANYVYVNHISDEMCEMIDSIPPLGEEGSLEAVDALYDLWLKNHNRLRISMSYIELNRVGDTITSMKSYAHSGDSAEYENAKLLLVNAIDEMRRLESFSMSNIF